MNANPADDPVLRLLQEARLEDDAALAALLDELKATAAEPPAPSRDVVRLMSGRRPARPSWFARRGARTTTVVLLAAALAGGASAAAAASPALHAVVGDAFSSLAKLVGPPAHPAAPASGHDEANEATPSPRHGVDHRGSAPGSTSGEAGDAQGTQAPTPSTAQEQSATEARLGAGSQAGAGGAGGAGASGDDPGRRGGTSSGSGQGQGAGGGQGDDQGASNGSSTQKQAPSQHQPAPTPAPLPPAAGSQTSQPGGGGSAGSDR